MGDTQNYYEIHAINKQQQSHRSVYFNWIGIHVEPEFVQL